MNELVDLVNAAKSELINQGLIGPLTAIGVAAVVSLIKNKLRGLDKLPIDTKAVPVVQGLVGIASFLALLGSNYLSGKVGETDIQAFSQWLMVWMASVGAWKSGKDFKEVKDAAKRPK